MALPETWPGAELPTSVHGTGVSYQGTGVLILGPAGAGKSSLALQLMALGAGLISDDLTWLELRDGTVFLTRPPQAATLSQIEARGIGILPAKAVLGVPLHLLVDMSEVETQRLPEPRHHIVAKRPIRTFRRVDNPAFPAMVLQYLKSAQG